MDLNLNLFSSFWLLLLSAALFLPLTSLAKKRGLKPLKAFLPSTGCLFLYLLFKWLHQLDLIASSIPERLAIVATVASLSHLLFLVFRPKDVFRLYYWVLQANNGVLFLLAPALHSAKVLSWYYLASLVLFIVIVAAGLGQSYTQSTDDFFRFKLRSIAFRTLGSALIFCLLFLSIPLLPGTAFSSMLVDVTAVASLASVSTLTASGQKLYLEHRLKLLLGTPEFQTPSALNNLSLLFETTKEQLREVSSNNSVLDSPLDSTQLHESNIRIRSARSEQFQLPQEIKLPSLKESVARSMELNRPQLSEQTNHLSKRSESLGETKSRPLLEHSDNLLRNTYEDSQIVVASRYFQSVLSRCEKLSNSTSSILFEGPSGSGKTTLAQHTHYLRGLDGLKVIDCRIQKERELFDTLSPKLLKLAGIKGLLIENLDVLNRKELSSLLPLLKFCQTGGENSVRLYLCTKAGFLSESPGLDYYSYYPFRTHRIVLFPLRDRQQEVLPLAEYFAHSFLGSDFKGFDKNQMHVLMNHSWPNNIDELRSFIRRSLPSGETDKRLLSIPSAENSASVNGERNELARLIHFLRLSDFNLSLAAKELGLKEEQVVATLESSGYSKGLFS